eukprot:TRINITY_DN757_c0_g7_i2.p1 TRINITY_DN757_c0_g7~~TRINITY_DN757_c0_g7_i2.p1  ORF type:complete len:376 (-),score=111.93 TRINITY_DN757_c0_g7_i2:85-1212(-)
MEPPVEAAQQRVTGAEEREVPEVYEGSCKEENGTNGAPMSNATEVHRRADKDNANEDDADLKTLSKRAKKRLLKRELRMQRIQAFKQEEKLKKKQETEKKRKERKEHFESLPEEEKMAAITRSAMKRQKRVQGAEEKKLRLQKAMQEGQSIVIDLEFTDLMIEGEVRSIHQQVMYSYAVNCKSENPFRLMLTGFRGTIKDHLLRTSGFDRWHLLKDEGSYMDVFAERRGDLVYLTADSPNTLHTLEEEKIYIIGGLVDRNRHKSLTLKKAEDQGIQTARLPLRENMTDIPYQVLTVNQVMEVLVKFNDLKSWPEALKAAVPQRKRGNGATLSVADQKGNIEADVGPETVEDEDGDDESDGKENTGTDPEKTGNET